MLGGISTRRALSSLRAPVALRAATPSAGFVKLEFDDGSHFRFHNLWLRDAARGEEQVSPAGERILTKIPLATGPVAAARFACSPDELTIHWQDSRTTKLTAEMLRAYANIVAEPLKQAASPPNAAAWLQPYAGTPDCPPETNSELWRGGVDGLPRFDYVQLAQPARNLELLQTLTTEGCAVIEGVRESDSAETLLDLAAQRLGGMQKDPARLEANWQIEKKSGAVSISYNHELRLNPHTDQSVPSHGIPALLLVVHYIAGRGANTLVDGFQAALDLKAEDPEAFELLCTYGNDQERDLTASRQDALGDHNQKMVISTKAPIIQLHETGALQRLQYNEVFRTPSTVPFHVFPKWYEAYLKFASMVNSPAYERYVPLEAGQVLILNNWRILHGRPEGRQTTDRKLVGGTVTRESFFSQARELCKLVYRGETYGSQVL